jgi:hypothetical protein
MYQLGIFEEVEFCALVVEPESSSSEKITALSAIETPS